MTQIANQDQAEFWSSPDAQNWIKHQDFMDQMLSGVLDTLMTHAAPAPGERVLDIGCGTGASCLALARAVGPEGEVLGFDISDPFLAEAARRISAAGLDQVRTVLGDAQVHAFADGAADLVVSRFGVMFFEDPVAAFANLLGATRPGGRLAMMCWQGAPQNPWFMAPMQAAMDRLGRPEPMDPLAPGPMAFKDVDRVTGILAQAGWAGVAGTPMEVDLVPDADAHEVSVMMNTIGPATRLMREKGGTPEDLEAIRAATEAALSMYQTKDGLRIPGRVILYTARRAG